jgi:hypothetical protein
MEASAAYRWRLRQAGLVGLVPSRAALVVFLTQFGRSALGNGGADRFRGVGSLVARESPLFHPSLTGLLAEWMGQN